VSVMKLIRKHTICTHPNGPSRDDLQRFAIDLLELAQTEGDKLAFEKLYKGNENFAYHRAILNLLEELRR
jgi:hypothetical protein